MVVEIHINHNSLTRMWFDWLVEWIHRDTALYSFPDPIYRHRAFATLVAFRAEAIPFLLEITKRSADGDRGCGVHIAFAALAMITETHPVIAKEDYGRIPVVAKAWTDWGRARGLVR